MLITSGVPGFIVYSILYKKVKISEHAFNKHNKVYLVSLFTILVFSITSIFCSLLLSIPFIESVNISSEYLKLGLGLLLFFLVSLLVSTTLGFLILPCIFDLISKFNFNKYLYQDTKSALTEAITFYDFDDYAPFVYVFDFENKNIINGPIKYIGHDNLLQFYGEQTAGYSYDEVIKIYNIYENKDFDRARIVLDGNTRLKYIIIHQDIEH